MSGSTFQNAAQRSSSSTAWGQKPARSNFREIFSAYGALFASFSTLVCCALPALLVLFGFGLTSVLAFLAAIPGWQGLGAYNMWLFSISGAVLAVGFYFSYFRPGTTDGQSCEIPEGGRTTACSTATVWNRRILWFSLFLLTVALITDFWGIGWMKSHGYFDQH